MSKSTEILLDSTSKLDGIYQFENLYQTYLQMKIYHCIGLMSGTSLDGLDICYAQFLYPNIQFRILKTDTLPYSNDLKSQLKNAIHLSGEELTKLDIDYGFILGKSVNDFMEKHEIKDIDFVASHGHTVFHNPKDRYTLQVGNGLAIAEETGLKTVYDFRTQDVILGGQGAPLVPMGDEILFSDYDACLNLGGFSNISFKRMEKRIAFDICPVNIVLNKLAEKIGMPFDKDGNIAKSGKINEELLKTLNNLDYYNQPPPKSLGIEWCIENIFPLFEQTNLPIEDFISTYTQHSAQQIAKVLNENSIKNVLITGGGAYNTYLIEIIQSLTETEIILPEENLIEFKEALLFGLLGLLRIENQVNVFKLVTGASKDHSSGIVVG
jgi:anhydro-N-acetylmuramic acid kinase